MFEPTHDISSSYFLIYYSRIESEPSKSAPDKFEQCPTTSPLRRDFLRGPLE